MNKKILTTIGILVFALILIAWQFQKESKIPTNPQKSANLSQVKVAVLYESVTEGPPIGAGRGSEDLIKLLKETHADMIFRGFWRWGPAMESPDNIPPEFVELFAERMKIKPEQVPLLIEKSGYNYKELERRISAIKKEMPNIIFVGAIPAQRINRIDKNDITGKVYTAEETWAIALDPQKWNIQKNGKPVTKEEFQALVGQNPMFGWSKVGESYDYSKVKAYFPDITNPEYQEILLSWAKRQIDAGADAIWIDGLPQTFILYTLTNDINHPAIKDSYEASKKIVDEIHRYGKAKGKQIYVGAWAIPIKLVEGLPEMPPNIDFVTMTPYEDEILNKKLDTAKWKERISKSRELYGKTQIFAFIDWSKDMSPTVIFSQRLSKEEQREVLKAFDDSFAKMGVNFIYPLHGGYMGKGEVTKKLAFGKYRNYDALAPEFQTYETIKELAQRKARKKIKEVKVETICTDGTDNDGDGLVDNKDGDCWIREGPIYETHPYYYPNHSFKEITQQIPYLANLGVKTIYLMPIWKEKKPEGGDLRYFLYYVDDYFQIDTECGTTEELKELIDTAHKHGMKVLFDLTTGTIPPGGCAMSSDNWIFKMPLSELKKKAEELGWTLEYTTINGNDYVYSGCRSHGKMECKLFGTIIDDKVVLHHYPRPMNGWAVNRSDPEVIEYFTKVAEYYVREFDIDGWRVDNPANNYNPDIISGNHSIQKLLRSVKKAIIKVKPDTILLAEGPMVERGINNDWMEKDPVLDELCEASYSYYLYYKLKEIRSSAQLIDTLKGERIWYNRERTRLQETHDTPRINERLPQRNKPLLVLISTIPGIPWVQAGQEIGARNSYFFDHQINPEVDWNNGNYELRDFYKRVFEIRNNNNALKYGSISNVWKSGDNVYAYSRTYENETVIVVISFQGKTTTSILNLPFKAGSMLKDELSGDTFTVIDPTNFKISLLPYGSRILTLKRGE